MLAILDFCWHLQKGLQAQHGLLVPVAALKGASPTSISRVVTAEWDPAKTASCLSAATGQFVPETSPCPS